MPITGDSKVLLSTNRYLDSFGVENFEIVLFIGLVLGITLTLIPLLCCIDAIYRCIHNISDQEPNIKTRCCRQSREVAPSTECFKCYRTGSKCNHYSKKCSSVNISRPRYKYKPHSRPTSSCHHTRQHSVINIPDESETSCNASQYNSNCSSRGSGYGSYHHYNIRN
ncbi:CLUMA_CG004227, isoform A [Clunio marinus]|uniref:CLUMA_CG004227, isoform A n=1 Tax=Clunio marinus TaxID=568069 RepID=A0A1J1HWE1_9DIPT|nr:CLUMA_CG004227, isoform A [Clunio marinus]